MRSVAMEHTLEIIQEKRRVVDQDTALPCGAEESRCRRVRWTG